MSSPDDRGPASRLNPTDRLLSMEFDSSALGSTARARDSSSEARGFRARSGDDSTGSLNAGSTGSGLSPDKLKFYDDIGLLDTNHESGKALTGSQVDDAALVAQSIAKPQSWKRWIILVLATLAIFGPYYSFDNPAGTAETLKENFGVPLRTNMNSTSAQNATVAGFNTRFNLLYSLYSFPNTVLPLVGGLLVDRIGFRRMTVICAIVATVGQVMFASGAYIKSWALMWAARSVFGIGTESLVVAQRILVAEWFIGGELAFSMGVVLAFGRLGSTINDNVSAQFDYCVDAYWVGVGLCVVSVLCAVLAVWMDQSHEDQVKAQTDPKKWEAFELKRSEQPPGQLSDIGKFSLRFWLFCALSMTCFPPISSFNNVSSQLITYKWEQMGKSASIKQANLVMGTLYATSAVLALGAGWVVDRTGMRAIYIGASAGLVAACHAILAFTDINVYVPVITLGLGFAFLAAAFWPAIAFVVPASTFGIAYGVVGAFYNTGLAVVPAIVGQLQPPACDGGYVCVESLFIALALAGCAIGIWSHCLEISDEQASKAEGEEGEDGNDGMELILPGELGDAGGGDFMLLTDTDDEDRETDDGMHGRADGKRVDRGDEFELGGDPDERLRGGDVRGDAVVIGRPPTHPSPGNRHVSRGGRRSTHSSERSPGLGYASHHHRQRQPSLGEAINRATARTSRSTSGDIDGYGVQGTAGGGHASLVHALRQEAQSGQDSGASHGGAGAPAASSGSRFGHRQRGSTRSGGSSGGDGRLLSSSRRESSTHFTQNLWEFVGGVAQSGLAVTQEHAELHSADVQEALRRERVASLSRHGNGLVSAPPVPKDDPEEARGLLSPGGVTESQDQDQSHTALTEGPL